MNANDLCTLAGMLGSNYSFSGNSIMMSCPNINSPAHGGSDRHPSFGIKVGDESVCNCFTCGLRGKLSWVMLTLLNAGAVENKIYRFVRKCESTNYKMSMVYVKETLPNKDKKKEHFFYKDYDYITKITKRVSFEEIKKYDIRFDRENKNIIFIFKDTTGKIVGAVGRSINGGAKHIKYSDNYFFGEQLLDMTKRGIILVEGPYDLINIKRYVTEYNCLSINGVSMTNEMMNMICHFSDYVILFLDGDNPGKVATEKLGKKLTQRMKTFVAKCPLGKDPGELTGQEIKKSLINKVFY